MVILEQYYKKIRDFVWRKDIESLPKYQQNLLQAARVFHLVVRDLFDGMLTLQSMSLVYTTLLSIVPLIAVSFSILKGFGVHNQVEPALMNLLAPLGEKGVEITHRIIEFVDNTKAGVLGSVGLLFLFYTVVSLIQKIESSFNYTWRVTQSRSVAQRFSNYLSVVVVGPVLIFSSIGITASIVGSSIYQQLVGIEAIGFLVGFVSKLVPYFLVILAFSVVYIFVPNTKVKPTSALVGALVAGILWQSIGWVFTSFVVSSTNYTAIYSAFATLILFMIWLYLCWLILLVGASFAYYYQHPEYRTLQKRHIQLSNRSREKIALLVMHYVCNAYCKGVKPLSEDELAKVMKVKTETIHPVIQHFIEYTCLIRTDSEPSGLVPARPPENLKISEALNVIRKGEDQTYGHYEQLPDEPLIDAIFVKLDEAVLASLGEKSFKEISCENIKE